MHAPDETLILRPDPALEADEAPARSLEAVAS